MTKGRGIVLMTAMPPTVGHGYLIDWSHEFCSQTDRYLHIIVGTQPSEPMPTERFNAVRDYLERRGHWRAQAHHFHREAQQAPKGPDDEAFWQTWCKHLIEIIDWREGISPNDIIISSETYGAELAARLGCKSIVCDPKREVIKVRGTHVRNTVMQTVRADQMLPEFLPYVQRRVTIYGAESTGKTTIAKNSYSNLNLPEYARPYLESLPSPEVTEARMEDIVYGQYAMMEAAKNSSGACLIVQDTDLLSTIGYYRIFNENYRQLHGYYTAVRLFNLTKSDLYLMTKSNIPFEPDPLRYGGNERQGTDEFWLGLLEEFGCRYNIVDHRDFSLHIDQANHLIRDFFHENKLWGFKR